MKNNRRFHTPIFNDFTSSIYNLPMRERFSQSDLLIPDFLLAQEGTLSIYYAPFDSVNENARIIIIGITPGWTQMEIAYRSAYHDFRAGIIPEEACRRAKQKASFAGSMRTNLITMLDSLGIQSRLGMQTSADLFGTRNELLHTTSVVRNPTFVNQKNYTGHMPRLLNVPILRNYVETILAGELNRLPSAIIVPLGRVVNDSLKYLCSIDVIDPKRCLWGFPHPSGANGHRVKEFKFHYNQLKSIVEQNFIEQSTG
jgi:hypothetical protein